MSNQKRETGAEALLVAAKGALAALSQTATFPADITAARKWLADAIEVAETASDAAALDRARHYFTAESSPDAASK
jgi:hypothetical protein